ncbi:MAG: GDP-mannose 4,6-dehydratase [Deltaproteobacteria bacterium]|nr:GDP-mannose 4,6-dehydratase [Deltaproteobacteria bacterium]
MNGTIQPRIGINEAFAIGDPKRVEQAISDIKALGVHELRLEISWAEYITPKGEEWYDWLIPRLAGEFGLLPVILSTPEQFGIEPKSSSPPSDTEPYLNFIKKLIERHGSSFNYLELWANPENHLNWDSRLDRDFGIFSSMMAQGSELARSLGKKTVLSFTGNPKQLKAFNDSGALGGVDVIGLFSIHDFNNDTDWNQAYGIIKELFSVTPKAVWITGAGYNTGGYDEFGQIKEFISAIDTPVERLYWSSLYDGDKPENENSSKLGLKKTDGTEKLLFRLLEGGGVGAVRKAYSFQNYPLCDEDSSKRPALIIGGAGFIGTNLAKRLLDSGTPVIIYDNLSRPGVEKNLHWLVEEYGNSVRVCVADVCDSKRLRESISCAGQVYHFAAQVAVTKSLVNPFHDFNVNAKGTLTLLEVLRSMDNPPPLIFTSTNKVYGSLENMNFINQGQRYMPGDALISERGINEEFPLDFHSPYGCSKGAADQYVIDYARNFGLPAVVFRMSCIYGPHQFGNEDQGWVAYFLTKAIEEEAITIYGDGLQVRDLLYIDDLVNAFILARDNINKIKGQAFNIGGGPSNTSSLLELIDLLGELGGERPKIDFNDKRTGDQKYYVSNSSKFKAATGWSPSVSAREGIKRLYVWLMMSKGFSPVLHLTQEEQHEICAD